MIKTDKNILLVIFSFLLLVLIPAAFAGLERIDAPNAVTIPIIIGIEFVLYFFAVMIANPKATVSVAAGGSVYFILIRVVATLIGSGIVAIGADVATGADNTDPISLLSNPISCFLQIAVLIFAGPLFAALIFPDLIGREAAEVMLGNRPSTTTTATRTGPGQGQPLDSSPSGGFIQAFSYEELAGIIKKSHGIEGFILYSSEGLVVWKDLPIRFDAEEVTARLCGATDQVGGITIGIGLQKPRRLMIEGRENSIIIANVNQSFQLMLLFNSRVSQGEVLDRVTILTKSCREFVQWKYPSLPLASGGSMDRIVTSEVAQA